MLMDDPERQADFEVLGMLLRRLENVTADIVMNVDGIIEAWRAPATVLLGWTSDEACGRTLAELVIPEHLRERHRDGLARWRTLGEAQVICRELRTMAIHKDGHLLAVHISVQIVQDDIGTRFLGWVRAIHDGAESF
jgi:PAS domain S-box-containing protein